MKFIFFILVLISFKAFSQKAEVKQLSLLLTDLESQFKQTKGGMFINPAGDTSYHSKLTLLGSVSSEISLASDNKLWAAYTAYISDSCNLKNARKFAQYWRDIIKIAAPTYHEEIQKGQQKTYLGKPFYGYDFILSKDNYKYWISILYSERPFHKSYSVILILGRNVL